MIPVNTKFITNFILFIFLFLKPFHNAALFLLHGDAWGWFYQVQLESLATVHRRVSLSSKETNVFFYSIQAPFCSSLHRNVLYSKWRCSNHHPEIRGKFRSTLYLPGSFPVPTPPLGSQERSSVETMPPLKELIPWLRSREWAGKTTYEFVVSWIYNALLAKKVK